MTQLSPSESSEIISTHAQGDTPESKEMLSFPEQFPEFVNYFVKEGGISITFSLNLFDRLSDRHKFEREWEMYRNKKSRKDLLDARTMWVAMKSQGEDFVTSLESWMRRSLEHASSRSELEFDLYQFIHIYHSLEAPERKEFYADLLSYPAVWNWHDGSVLHDVLEQLLEHQDPSLAPKLLALIDNMLLPGYQRELQLAYDLHVVARTLVAVVGDQAFQLLDDHAEQDPTFAGYWEKIKLAYQSKKMIDNWNPLGEKQAKKDSSDVFDVDAEKAYLAQLTEELEKQPEKKHNWSKLADPYDDDDFSFPSGNHDNWADMADTNDDEFFEENETREEKLSEPTRMVIKGSVAYAMKMGKDLRLARDIDIYLVSENDSPEVHIQDFSSLEELKEKLPTETVEPIERFLKEHKIEDMPIQLVQTSSDVLDTVRLFDDEPQVVLWDASLELVKKRRQSDAKSKPLSAHNLMDESLDEMLDLYGRQRLVQGEMPEAFIPRDGRLSAMLRLVDLGERFDLPVDDEPLLIEEERAEAGSLEITIPDETDVGKDGDFTVRVEETGGGFMRDYYGKKRSRRFVPTANESGVLDIAFVNAALRKGLLPLLEKRYPTLATIVKNIEVAGGIREYVRKTYGEIYLKEERIPLNTEPLIGIPLPGETQRELYGLWQSSRMGEVFGSLKELVDTYIGAKAKGEIQEDEDTDTLQIALMKYRTRLCLEQGANDPKMRLKGYQGLLESARAAQFGDLATQQEYQQTKEELKRYLFDESDKRLKKMLANGLVSLANGGDDLSIASDLIDVVRKDASRIKREKTEKKQILSPEAMVILHGLFRLDNPDTNKTVFELLANPEIDPRLKKACLKNLVEHQHFHGFNEQAMHDLKKPAHEIVWEDYGMLYRLDNIASKTVRNRLRSFSCSSAATIRREGSISHLRKEIAPELPGEFFLPLYSITSGDRKALSAWNALIGSIKSQRLRDGILYSLSTLLNADRGLTSLITEKLIRAPQVTKEHALLADRLMKKIHFLRVLEERRRDDGVRDSSRSSCERMLKETKAPSMLEATIDQALVAGLYEMTGRGDLSADKLQSLFRTWEDPEPVLLYTAELSRYAGASHGVRKNQHATTLALMGEMLVHMDPPELKEWKDWRYSNDDPVLAEQMKGLSPESKEAYAEDDFVDLGEVLVGLLPSDKPRRIQDEVFHLFTHRPEEGKETELKFLRHAPKTKEALGTGTAKEKDGAIRDDLDVVATQMRHIDRWMTLQDDLLILERLPQQLLHWQQLEGEKREALRALGYRGDEESGEISAEVLRLQKNNESEKAAQLATLKPTTVPDRVNGFLNRHHLPKNVSPEDMIRVRRSAEEAFAREKATDEFVLVRERFAKADLPSRREFQLAQQELRATETFLRLSLLTPQLIAFNRLVPGKKKLTLQKSLQTLKDFAKESNETTGVLTRIEGVLQEENHGVGKDHLAVIFTDHPLALLTVGSYPTGAESCQRYTNGDPALGSYLADASTKMLMLVDLDKLPEEIKQEFENASSEEEKLRVFGQHPNALLEAMVARRLTKVVRETSGRPQVFLEPVYTSLDRNSMTRLLNAYAVTRLQVRTGLEVVRGGGFGQVAVAESRNGIQYEDGESGGPGGGGAGVGQMSGSYTMSAQPLTKADYLL